LHFGVYGALVLGRASHMFIGGFVGEKVFYLDDEEHEHRYKEQRA